MTIARNRTAWLAAALVAVIATAITVVFASGGNARQSAAATTVDSPDSVTVSGTAAVQGKPDTIFADLDVHAKRATVQQALNSSIAAVHKVVATLHADGIQDKDIQTTDAELYAHYGRHGRDGYVSSQSLHVRIYPLKNAGKILGDAGTSAGNHVSIEGINFDIANDEGLITAAQGKAFDTAKTAAAKDAQLAGRSLGRVISMKQSIRRTDASSYDSASGSGGTASAGSSGAASIPVEAGQQPVEVTVTVVWELTG